LAEGLSQTSRDSLTRQILVIYALPFYVFRQPTAGKSEQQNQAELNLNFQQIHDLSIFFHAFSLHDAKSQTTTTTDAIDSTTKSQMIRSE